MQAAHLCCLVGHAVPDKVHRAGVQTELARNVKCLAACAGNRLAVRSERAGCLLRIDDVADCIPSCPSRAECTTVHAVRVGLSRCRANTLTNPDDLGPRRVDATDTSARLAGHHIHSAAVRIESEGVVPRHNLQYGGRDNLPLSRGTPRQEHTDNGTRIIPQNRHMSSYQRTLACLVAHAGCTQLHAPACAQAP